MMVVFSVLSTRSYIILECSNIIKRRGLCSKGNNSEKPSANYHYDINEIKHHDSMAKDWWDPKGPTGLLQKMNDLRIPFIKNGLVNSHRLKALEVKNKVKFLEGVKILDIGCGGGILSEALARLGGTVTGIDPSETLIGVAKSHSLTMKDGTPPTYIQSTIEDHAHLNMAAYDVVIASEVIEHVTDKESFLAASIAALNLGGSLFLTTPNRTMMSWIGGIVMAENVMKLTAKGTHNYSKFIKPSEMTVLLEKYGCSIQLINGMFYDPIRSKWVWCPSKAFLYALHAIKIKDLFRR